jgi:hypothetical protein
LLLLGLAIFTSAAIIWAKSGFGPITNPLIPRSVIAGLTTTVIGLQTFFSAFMLGVLAIPLRTIEASQSTRSVPAP